MKCASVAQLLGSPLVLQTHFLCLNQFFVSFLACSGSYFLQQYNSRALNNRIRGGENRRILVLKTLLPIESAQWICAQIFCAVGTLNNKSSFGLFFQGTNLIHDCQTLVTIEFTLAFFPGYQKATKWPNLSDSWLFGGAEGPLSARHSHGHLHII